MALSYGFCLGEENSQYDSKQFSESFQAVFGDGITAYGNKFAITATDSMIVNIASGFALVAGRWIKSDSADTLTIQPADNNYDRYDAVIIRCYLGGALPSPDLGFVGSAIVGQAIVGKTEDDSTIDTPIIDTIVPQSISIEVVQGLASAFPTPYTPVRNARMYEIMLCSIFVQTGITQIHASDITDTRGDPNLCGYITPLQDVAIDVLHIYNFLNSGIDEQVAALEAIADAISAKADQTIAAITSAMQQAGVAKPIGEIEFGRTPKAPNIGWLLCDGSAVPSEYSTLSVLLDGTLPNISQSSDRYQAWIYAGTPDNV